MLWSPPKRGGLAEKWRKTTIFILRTKQGALLVRPWKPTKSNETGGCHSRKTVFRAQDTFDHNQGQKSAVLGRSLHWIFGYFFSSGFFSLFSFSQKCVEIGWDTGKNGSHKEHTPEKKDKIGLRYYRCDTPYRAILFQGGWHSPKMVRYPALVLSFSQAHLCDTPFCNLSRDNCAIPHENKHEIILQYYRCKYRAI